MTTIGAERGIRKREIREPAPHRWTCAAYNRIGELGLLGPEPHVELIDGEIIDKVSPQSTLHAVAVRVVKVALDICFGPEFEIRCQLPITLSANSEPEPDVTVAIGSARDYLDHHPAPNDIRLLVEVSDSSLKLDRGRKARLYAAAGIADYWIVNLAARVVAVYRDPAKSSGYASTNTYGPNDTISPLARPDGAVAVCDLLP